MSTWQHGTAITGVEMDIQSLVCFSLDADGCVVCLDMKHNSVQIKFIAHLKKITNVMLDAKEGLLVSASEDNTAKVWRVWVKEIDAASVEKEIVDEDILKKQGE